MIPAGWSPETLTARQVVAYRDVFLSFECDGCRLSVEFNAWKIGARLADECLCELRFRCFRCGVYPSTLHVGRRTSMAPQKLMTIPLKPRAWDDGHREDQARCLARARAAFEAKQAAGLQTFRGPPKRR